MAQDRSSQSTVLFVSLYTVMGGAEWCLYHQVKNLDRERYRALVLVNGRGALTERLAGLPVEVLTVPFPVVMLRSLLSPSIFLRILAASLSIRRELRSKTIDVIQCSDVLSLILLLPTLITRRIPVVYSVLFFYEPARTKMLKRFGRYLFRIVADSSAVRNELLDTAPGLAQKTIVIHHAVDANEFRPASESEKPSLRKTFSLDPTKKIVGFIGRYDVWKGHRTFLSAAEIICAQRSDVQFVMAGGALTGGVIPEVARYREEIMAKAKPFIERGDLVVLGHRGDIPDLIRTLDVLVCPSDREPFGLIILEAYAAGIPIVASETVGALELLKDAQYIFSAALADAKSFADKILEALANEEILANTPEREEFLRMHTWQNYTRKFERIYGEIASIRKI